MTEYWVSQGNKWCDFCKIFISNNPLSIRTHELGTRHKDNVAKRLSNMRKDSEAKEKEQKKAVHALTEIEAKAKRSYEKDLKSFEKAAKSSGTELEYSKQNIEAATSSAIRKEDGVSFKSKGGPAPGLVISSTPNPKRVVKGAPSSIAVNKRKREDGKSKPISKEEAEALKAREAARKRVEEREKPLLGLYKMY